MRHVCVKSSTGLSSSVAFQWINFGLPGWMPNCHSEGDFFKIYTMIRRKEGAQETGFCVFENVVHSWALGSRAAQVNFDPMHTPIGEHDFRCLGAAIWTLKTNKGSSVDTASWLDLVGSSPLQLSSPERYHVGVVLCVGYFLWCCRAHQVPCPKDLQNCPATATTCPALLIVAESTSVINPLGLDDCKLGPTQIELELDPPQRLLGYEYWDNDHVPTKLVERSLFQWRNDGSTSCWASKLVPRSSSIQVFQTNVSCYILDVKVKCYRRKFRSQTSVNMDRWKSRGSKSQRREGKKEDQKQKVRRPKR